MSETVKLLAIIGLLVILSVTNLRSSKRQASVAEPPTSPCRGRLMYEGHGEEENALPEVSKTKLGPSAERLRVTWNAEHCDPSQSESVPSLSRHVREYNRVPPRDGPSLAYDLRGMRRRCDECQ